MKTFSKISGFTGCMVFVLLCQFSSTLGHPFQQQVLEDPKDSSLYLVSNTALENLPENLKKEKLIEFTRIRNLDTLDAMKGFINRYERVEEEKIKAIRFKRGIKRRNYFKRRRVARHKNKIANSTKQQLRSGGRNALVRSNTESNFHNALQNQRSIELSTSVLKAFNGLNKLRQVSLEILLRTEERPSSSSTRRVQDRIKFLPFLIHRQKNEKLMIVARGQQRESRRSHSPEFGVNHSGRTRSSAWIRRYEFGITHLLQRVPKETINFTEMSSETSGSLEWVLQELQLSVICVRKKQIVSCPRRGIRMVDSPRFIFHTFS